MNKYQIAVTCLVLGVVAQGCATAANRKLDEKLSQETSVKSRNDLKAEATDVIEKTQGLTTDQRSGLEALKSTAGVQMDQINQQSLKLRAILVKDLISSHYDMDEVDLIKGRLSSLEDQRLNVILGAVSKANDIMGRQAAENEFVFKEFSEGRSSRD